MNVVDSSGWLEYFVNGPTANFFAPAIQNQVSLIVPTISIYEVFKKVLADKGKDPALEAIAIMYGGLIIDLTKEIALKAAQISHNLKLPMTDSIILATARVHHAVLWSQDTDFKDLEGVKYIHKSVGG